VVQEFEDDLEDIDVQLEGLELEDKIKKNLEYFHLFN
jgi:hypothetical protein